MAKKHGSAKNVSAKAVVHAVVWAVENPRHWRKLSRIIETQGATDAFVLSWLLREARETLGGHSMRWTAELAHELVGFERVIRSVS